MANRTDRADRRCADSPNIILDTTFIDDSCSPILSPLTLAVLLQDSREGSPRSQRLPDLKPEGGSFSPPVLGSTMPFCNLKLKLLLGPAAKLRGLVNLASS